LPLSQGCAGQYKSKHNFHKSCHHREFFIQMEWCRAWGLSHHSSLPNHAEGLKPLVFLTIIARTEKKSNEIGFYRSDFGYMLRVQTAISLLYIYTKVQFWQVSFKEWKGTVYDPNKLQSPLDYPCCLCNSVA